jgi:transcription-repair coupling factor (superfamily II helicase)
MMEELGSGFYLAMHDLEIRGAGEVLGENQSGEIQQVGFSLYTEMLKRAVQGPAGKARSPTCQQPLEVVSEINLHAPALLPSDYCSDVQERLTLYKRLANCESEDDLRRCRKSSSTASARCRPRPARLLETHRLRMLVKPYGCQDGRLRCARSASSSGKNAPIDPVKVIMLIQKDRSTKMSGPTSSCASSPAPNLKSAWRR